MKNFLVVGAGYVGLSTGIMLAKKHSVTFYDIDKEKIKLLNNGILPIKDELGEKHLISNKKNINAISNLKKNIFNPDYVVIALPTNFIDDLNKFDTSVIENFLGSYYDKFPDALFVIKSTVPCGFTSEINKSYKNVIFSPEFIREGSALYDSLNPSRIVIGSKLLNTKDFVISVLQCINNKDTCELIYMDPTEAEAVKLFSNTYLAMRVSFFNELDTFSHINNLKTNDIIKGIVLDPRIGNFYNNPSFGYGGYCLPKDTKQLISDINDDTFSLINNIDSSNNNRIKYIVDEIRKIRGKIGLYKLAMKSDSDNFRESSMYKIMNMLLEHKIKISLFEPNIQIQNEEFIKNKHIRIYTNLELFKKDVDVIIANRIDKNICNIEKKVFSRDIFNNN